jgi:MFS family permease
MLWQLYVVALTAGVATVFFDVSYQSYLPVLLKPENLMDGNGKLGATQAFAQFTGPGLGGGLVGAVGAATAMWADAISYVVSVASLFGIRIREQRVEAPPEHRNLRAEIAEGLKFVVKHPILRKIVACTGTSNLFSAMAMAIEIVFLIRVLHVHPAYTGLLFAISAIGGIAGGVFAGRLARRIGSARIIWFSILVFGLPQFLPALAEPGWLVALFPIGYSTLFFSAVVYNVAQVSYRQAVTPPQLMGRMNAAVRWIVWGTLPLGGIIGGALGSTIGIRPTLWIGFIGSWAAGFWVYFSPLRKMRDIPSQLTGRPCPPTGPAAATAAMARSRDTQASRECAQRRLSSSQMPASGSPHRFPIASAATDAAFQSSSSSMSCRAAAASSASDSPSASSWNCPHTQFPARAVPPGNPRSPRSCRSSGIGCPLTVYPGIRSGPSASSRSVTNRTAPVSSGCGPRAATARPA